MSNYWFEVVMHPDAIHGGAQVTDDRSRWLYMVGTGHSTPIALVAGPDDYTACARARLITKALNNERRRMLAAAREDEGE